jgi:hypothetical protein
MADQPALENPSNQHDGQFDQAYVKEDSVFRVWRHAEPWCLSFAKSCGVDAYLIDAFPIDSWPGNSTKPAVTNAIILKEIAQADRLLRVKDSFYGVYYYPYPCEPIVNPSKAFNCFINRMDPIRQSWLYQLVRRKLFDQGYVSFNMITCMIPDLAHLDPHEAFERQFQEQLSIFQPEHDAVKSRVPYKNFVCDGDLTKVILDSKFSIVLETYFDKNTIITYTEKIFRALQLPQPWLLFGSKHAVKNLKSMGFDVLDDVVDHDYYDNIDVAVERQLKILDLAEKYVHETFDQDRCIQAARHNQSILEQYALTWKQDYKDTVLSAAQHG